MEHAWLLWDLGALVLVLLCVGTAARHGFVRTVISFFSYVIAAVAANMLSRPAAAWLYENAVSGFVKGVLTGSLRETLAKNGGAREFAAGAPVWLRGSLEALPESALSSIDFTQSAARAVDVFVDSALRDTLLWILSGLCFLFLFSVLAFLVRQFAKLFTGVQSIPLIGTVNTVLGGCLGAIQAVILLIVIAVAARLLVVLTDGGFSWLSPAVFDQSFFMRFFYNLTAL